MPQSASLHPHEVAFELKGRMTTLTVLHLWTTDLDMFDQQLQHKVEQAPGFFENTPLVIDLAAIQSQQSKLDVHKLLEVCKSRGFIPVAARGVLPAQKKQLIELGVGILSDERPQAQAKPAKKEQHAVEPQKPAASSNTMFVDQPVRSGQQVYSRGDLIIATSVSPGAEILADGNIHVYGALRGRALAGVQGDTSARIFCHKLEAELVSVAGSYRVNEDIPPELRTKPVQIFMEGESLKIIPSQTS